MTVLRIALAELRQHPRRVVAVVVSIVLAVGYLVASVTVLAGTTTALERGVIERTAGTDVVVTLRAMDPRAQAALAHRVAAVPGVASADLSYLSRGSVSGSSEWVQQQSVPANAKLRWTDLTAGRWPAGPDDIALGATTARQLNLRLGDRVTVHDTTSSVTLTVTGLVRESGSLLSGLAQRSFVAPSYYTGAPSIRTSLQTEILVVGDGSVAAARLAAEVTAVAGDNRVETSTSFGRRKMSEATGGVFVLHLMLLVFGAIALLVGAIMIVNTFVVLVAQRRRQIGLLRALGAGRWQILRALLAEAAAIGVAGAVLGTGAGIGLAAVVAAALDGPLTVPVGQVSALAAVGVAVTLAAVLVPARQAMRVAPLDALRPVADRPAERRFARLRAAAAALLGCIGLAGIAWGSGERPYALLFTVGGAFVAAVALLSASGIIVPALLRGVGRALRRGRPTVRLAHLNVVRNPGRTAATAAALMLAVGLVVTLQVGAASMTATAERNLSEQFPIDVTVSVFGGALPERTIRDVAGVAGVAEVAALPSARVRAGLRGRTTDVVVLSPGPDALALVPVPVPPLRNTVLADPYLLADTGVRDGTRVTLTGPSGSVTVPVRAHDLAPADAMVVGPDVMRALDARAPAGTLWARTRPDADITALRSQLRAVVAPITGAEVGGGLSAKAGYREFLEKLLTVTLMLLGVAVLIALIGVGNTLGLSVLERARESALLRALGLQGRQLRWMLAIEATLLSLAGTVLGTAAGVLFGYLGTRALSDEVNFRTVVFSVSPPRLLTVAAVALAAGVLASVLPGRRAARAAPIEALTD
ncbi:ABC transporter permease [Paractinoplanes abujensis]|uniref:Putative ABC transport system permease protein n=1 Tax=Paractinoplanes abujensis TaxID=882441 RepID=A0A7W7CTZ3_9ACTN|nr:FtsX family ABC transporter permease [Actinoplanes abujensis]MBB4692961.1 putative ABC transport system permease protein [Actinoplanes abujensis]GID22536.1 ABC transporter permease [Actinoplanes abujensis]